MLNGLDYATMKEGFVSLQVPLVVTPSPLLAAIARKVNPEGVLFVCPGQRRFSGTSLPHQIVGRFRPTEGTPDPSPRVEHIKMILM